jgi:hypothetical protein
MTRKGQVICPSGKSLASNSARSSRCTVFYRRKSLARKIEFDERSQADRRAQLRSTKIVLPFIRKYAYLCASRFHSGALRPIVTNVGGGMRWTRWCGLTRRADADGKDVWSWRPDAGVKSWEMISRRRGLSSPAPRRHPGERAISRKPSRRECRIVSAYLQ